MIKKIPLKFEIERKAIHLTSNLIPLYYYFSHQKTVVETGLLILLGGFLLVDISRLKFSLVKKLFFNIFGVLLRDKETKKRLTGATSMLIGMTLTVFLFNEKQAVPALFFAGLADPAAAIVGRIWGKNKFWNKSLEGTLAFYLTASVVILVFTQYSWWGLIVALIVSVLELLPLGIDDNFLIPIVTAYLLSVA